VSTFVTERISEKVADYGAVGAVTSPFWLPSVHDVSQWCADALPIVGFAWLLIQIGIKAYDRYTGNKSKEE
jgi:hypothetical protein